MSIKSNHSSAFQNRLIVGIFILALAFNFWGISVGWNHINLAGYEFRQTQTAISAFFIQKEHDFSLAYPTPVLGKPWSIPMEFPLYQWTVVFTANVTGIPLTQAGRLISAICFFLALAALYLLLRRFDLKATHSLIILSLILVCPLYIFYARAFLIETMALMFGLWYMLALIRTLEERGVIWLLAVNAAGIGVGVVKVTTFIIFLIPAFFWALWLLWKVRPLKKAGSRRPLFTTFGWLTAAHALPFIATVWWVHFSDSIKALNPLGKYLQSFLMNDWNFGISKRFNIDVWSAIWNIISQEITPPIVLLSGGLLMILTARRWYIHIALLLGLYGLVLFTFPVLYAWHAYYHVASAFLLILTLGLVLISTFQSARVPRVLAFSLWIGLLFFQASTFLTFHYPLYQEPGNGGGLAAALHEIVQPQESLIIAGDDWSSILPYYAERRALMIPSSQTENHDHIRAAFAAMKDEAVGALVLFENQQNNPFIRQLAADCFDISSTPFLTWKDRGRNVVVYLNRQIEADALVTLHRLHNFYGVRLAKETTSTENLIAGRVIYYDRLMSRHKELFRIMNPRPVRFYSSFGPELWDETKAGQERYACHPETKLWFELAPGRHRLITAIELIPGAYQNVPYPDASDGIELVAAAIKRDGNREILQRRYFNPRDNPSDRGVQPIDWSFTLTTGDELEISVNAGPKGNAARDWSALSALKIQ